MKLREALTQINREELFQILCGLEKELNDANYTLEECKEAYNPVIEELLSHGDTDTSLKIAIVKEMTGPAYYDIHIIDKYLPGDTVSLGGSKWGDIASASIICNTNDLDINYQVAYILWELTYDGWTEKEQMEFVERIKGMVDKSNYKDLLNDE